MKKLNNRLAVFIGFITLLVVSCTSGDDYYPKPLGFYRVSFQEDSIRVPLANTNAPFTFNHSSNAIVQFSNGYNHNIYYPKYKAMIYATYIQLDPNSEDNNLAYHVEFSRKLAYEHSIKADQIKEDVIEIDSNQVYGVAYSIDGNVASNYQFFLTDTLTNFYRGALYFEIAPNVDSIQPVLDYIKQDIGKMVQSFEWKK